MGSWFFPGRATESSAVAVAASGAGGGGWGRDPIDGDSGYAQLGVGRREVPSYTVEKARVLSIAAYRTNPMARAIVDTYTAFGVGDSGVMVRSQDPKVQQFLDRWWNDPRNKLGPLQPAMMRDWMLQGEFIPEYMVGPRTGVVHWSPIDPAQVLSVDLDRGNALWPKQLNIRNTQTGAMMHKQIAQVDEISRLRTGDVGFFPSWKAVLTDRRGTPFLMPLLDDLEAYSVVFGNLIDRTALARYMVWDVTLSGAQADVDEFVRKRGGTHAPPSGSVEVHNESVTWKPQAVDTKSAEDSITLGASLTNVAAGAGLAKTWLADPEDANRATSLSMAEPVRRRVGGVQQEWLSIDAEMAKYAIDRAVAAGQLDGTVQIRNAVGDLVRVPASETVFVTGPEIAASDAQVTAAVFVNLSTALEKMVASNVLSLDASKVAAQKAWEQFVGQPFRPDLATDANVIGNSKPKPKPEDDDESGTEGNVFRLTR